MWKSKYQWPLRQNEYCKEKEVALLKVLNQNLQQQNTITFFHLYDASTISFYKNKMEIIHLIFGEKDVAYFQQYDNIIMVSQF